ncbi:oligosaccharide flippase family protein [Psychromonas sp. MME2]|uniref:lipopolysaccharide biosynthesis protein n=1 Tax=unclassified Psychromonas TaxID=2614957 RepID=UPI00339CE872
MSSAKAISPVQSPMRRVLSNFLLLARGRVVAALMLFGVTALLARVLGPVEFGMIVLIETYALLTRGLLNFKLFDAIVRFGVPAYDAKDTRTLRRLIQICWRLDLITTASGAIIAILLAPVVGPHMGMDSNHVFFLTLYSFVIFASIGNGTSRGLLRLFDKFDIIGKQMSVGPLVRFVGVCIAWWFDASFAVFISILAIGSISEDLYLNFYGWREYRKKIGPAENSQDTHNMRVDEFTGLRHFIWVTYWQANVDMVPKRITVMLAGYLLGASEAGLLRLARQFSSLLSQPAALIRQVVFLDLTRSWNQGSSDFKVVAYRTAMLGALFGLVFVVVALFFGEALLQLTVGQEYIAAAPVLALLLFASTLDLTASSLRSASYAIGHAGLVLRVYTLSALLYLVMFFALTSFFSLIGAGIAACVGAAIPPMVMLNLIHKSILTIPVVKKKSK